MVIQIVNGISSSLADNAEILAQGVEAVASVVSTAVANAAPYAAPLIGTGIALGAAGYVVQRYTSGNSEESVAESSISDTEQLVDWEVRFREQFPFLFPYTDVLTFISERQGRGMDAASIRENMRMMTMSVPLLNARLQNASRDRPGKLPFVEVFRIMVDTLELVAGIHPYQRNDFIQRAVQEITKDMQ